MSATFSAGAPSSPTAPTGASISGITRTTARATSSSTSTRSGPTTAIDFVGIDNYMPLSDWRDGSDHLDAASSDDGRSVDVSPRQYRGRRGLRLVLCQRCRQAGADAHADHRRRLRQALGLPLQGPRRLVGQRAPRPARRDRSRRRRPRGCRKASRSGSRSSAARRSTRDRTSPTSSPTRNRRRRAPLFLEPRPRRSRPAPLHRREPRLLGPGRSRLRGVNPVSGVYGGRMVRSDAIHLWTWDARPFPAFPYRLDLWSDGENWETGHWLSGRLGALPASDLVEAILGDYGATAVAVGELDGVVDGYVIGDVVSARQALTPLADLLMFDAFEIGRVRPLRLAPAAGARHDRRRRPGGGGGQAAPFHPAGAGDGAAGRDIGRLCRHARRFSSDFGQRAAAGHRQPAERGERDRRRDEQRRGERPRRCAAPGSVGRPRDHIAVARHAGARARAGRHLQLRGGRQHPDGAGDADRGRRRAPHRGPHHRAGYSRAAARRAARPHRRGMRPFRRRPR